MILVLGSFILIPIYVMSHPSFGVIAHDFVVPSFPKNAQFSTVMILIIGIVGTTVAPWQLFFQQSYVIDKKITIRFMRYEKADLLVGILLVILGAAAMMAFSAAAFRGHSTFESFSDAKGVAEGLGKYSSHLAGIFFAIALIDASIIGASAVGLSTSYAIADVMGFSHSLNHRPKEAKLFFAVSAIIVAIPGSPLGLLTEGVQTLAGILLPSAVVFLLLLCNDKEVVGPWVNSRKTNVFTSIIVAFLIMLSTILTASVLFSHISKKQIIGILLVGTLLFAGAGLVAIIKMPKSSPTEKMTLSQKMKWRMAPINELQAPVLSPTRKIWLAAMRGYLVIASLMVIVKVIELARGR
jgi:Mn2+/Fe2+ NRAMP family transporter